MRSVKPKKRQIQEPYIPNPTNPYIGPIGPTGATGPSGTSSLIETINVILGITGTINTNANSTLITSSGITGNWVAKIDNMNNLISKSDDYGNIYVSCTKTYEVFPPVFYNRDGTTGSFFPIDNVNTQRSYLAKYTPTGFVEWYSSQDTTNVDILANNNGVYLVGYYNGSTQNFYNSNLQGVTIGATLGQVDNTTELNYLCKYNSNGTAEWATYYNSSQTKISYYDHLYLFCSLTQPNMLAFNIGGITSSVGFTLPGNGNFAILEYTEDGTCVNGARIEVSNLDFVNHIYMNTIADKDNIYISSFAYTTDPIKFYQSYSNNNNTVGVTLFANNTLQYNGILAKYDKLLKPVWATQSYNMQNIYNSLAVNANKDIFVSGNFTADVGIDNIGYFTNSDKSIGDEIKINQGTISGIQYNVCYDNNGYVKWVNTLRTDTDEIYVSNANCDNYNNNYLTGYFLDSNTLTVKNSDDSSYTEITRKVSSSPSSMIYVLKQNKDGIYQTSFVIDSENSENLSSNITSVHDNSIIVSGRSTIGNNVFLYNPDGTTFATVMTYVNSGERHVDTAYIGYIANYSDTCFINLSTSTPTNPTLNKTIIAKTLNGANVNINIPNIKINQQNKNKIKMSETGNSVNLGWNDNNWFIISNNNNIIE